MTGSPPAEPPMEELAEPCPLPGPAAVASNDIRTRLQAVMTDRAGVLRSASGLSEAVEQLIAMTEPDATPGTAGWEATNLLTISLALAEAARRRQETRGSHWREDYPERDDEHWAGHIDVTLHGGAVALAFHHTGPTDGSPA